jgi:hypothetical protein
VKYDGSLDAFGLKLDPSKTGSDSIQYFTYLGSEGLQTVYAVDFDSSGDMFLGGSTTTGMLQEFGGPTKAGLDGDPDAFLIGFPATPAPIESPSVSPHTPGVLRRPHLPVLPHR